MIALNLQYTEMSNSTINPRYRSNSVTYVLERVGQKAKVYKSQQEEQEGYSRIISAESEW